MPAISKGSLEGCLVYLDTNSTAPVCLTQQSLQIPKHANDSTLPSWLFDACLSIRDRRISSHPDAILVTPVFIKSKPLSTPHLQQVTCTVQLARSHEELHRAYDLKLI